MANVSSSNGLEKRPKLRFPGFDEPWQPTLLSSIFAKNTKKNTDGQITNVICNSAKQGLIPQREYFDKDIANSDNTNGYYIIEENDFVYNPRKSAVYGNFALAGSIFLDTRNERDFSDAYSLLYGHHMENSGMFGDLDLYKDQAFFDDNKTGMLILPDRSYNLEIFACLLVEAGEDTIFDPELWQTDINGLLSFAENNSLHLREETIDKLRQMENPKVLALSTCSTEFTDARTIILAVMEPYQTADQEDK